MLTTDVPRNPQEARARRRQHDASRQTCNGGTHRDRRAHLEHEGRRRSRNDREAAVSSGEYAYRVEKLVSNDLGAEHGNVRCEESDDHRDASLALSRREETSSDAFAKARI